MTINEKIIDALKGLGDISPGVYRGKAKTYYVFSYDLSGPMFADNIPKCELALVQVHFFCPLACDALSIRGETRRRLLEAGFTWPAEIDASDEDGQHYVYECQIEIAL